MADDELEQVRASSHGRTLALIPNRLEQLDLLNSNSRTALVEAAKAETMRNRNGLLHTPASRDRANNNTESKSRKPGLPSFRRYSNRKQPTDSDEYEW